MSSRWAKGLEALKKLAMIESKSDAENVAPEEWAKIVWPFNGQDVSIIWPPLDGQASDEVQIVARVDLSSAVGATTEKG